MAEADKRRVLLIGWDGADWRVIRPLLENEELPYLEKLINQGVMGNLPTLQPTLSPLIWNSIATGKLPDKHGILGFTEIDEKTGEVRPSTTLSRKTKAIWNILSQQNLRTHVINWFVSHPAEPVNGVYVSEVFFHSKRKYTEEGHLPPIGSIHPESLVEEIKALKVYPQDIDPQTISLFVQRFREVDQHNDRRLLQIARLLAECFSVHAAATWVMENEPWDFMAVYYPEIDRFCHGFMKFHPPKMDWIDKKDFEFYHDVINSAYRLHDLLLGRLLYLAGEDTTVILCSDHGHYIGDLRPRFLAPIPTAPAEEHRPIGILCMKGPGINEDELIHGANPLDITPTILTLFGLPVGRDMDGRPLIDVLGRSCNSTETIPSWDNVPGPAGMHLPEKQVEPGATKALLDQFVALGYVEPPEGDESSMAELTLLENNWNLARVYLYSGRFSEALPFLEKIYYENLLRFDFGLALAECRFRVGLREDAYELMCNLARTFPGQAKAWMLLGLAEYEMGYSEKALEHLLRAEKANFRSPFLYLQLGRIYLHLRRHADATIAFQHALDIDPDTAPAYLGLARCLLRYRQYEKTADAALKAVSLEFSMADAHLYLGISLVQLGQTDRAVQAFEACLRFRPQHAVAHRYLSRLYATMPDGAEKAEHHRYHERESLKWRSKFNERKKRILKEASRRAEERKKQRNEESIKLMKAISGSDLPSKGEAPESVSSKARTAISTEKEFMIVSGLPRSGTSLMMQMLHAGGVPIMTDGKRLADEDNPEGYFEWEAIKRVDRNPRIIEQAEDKAIKVISMLLFRLPRIHRYKIIFMCRPGEEIAASQIRMLERQGKTPSSINQTRLAELLHRHQETTLKVLQQASRVKILPVDYPELVAEPETIVPKIVEFLGPGIIKTPEAITSAVKPELYRQRM